MLRKSGIIKFQLTRLMRGVTTKWLLKMLTEKISTHTPHARRDKNSSNHEPKAKISTHTPHARRDGLEMQATKNHVISTHTPHARRDNNSSVYVFRRSRFQLTRLMRGVTQYLQSKNASVVFQLTRLMRGVTESCFPNIGGHSFQLTRLMRGVTACRSFLSMERKFQLTRLMRGVTSKGHYFIVGSRDFNSHASCEA